MDEEEDEDSSEEDDDDTSSEISLYQEVLQKKAQNEIDALQKSTQELKQIRKTKILENQNPQRKLIEPESGLKIQKMVFTEMWKRVQAQ